MLFVSFYFYLFIFGCAGYSLLHGFCSSCERESYSVVLVLRLLVAVASLVGAHGLGAHGLHCWGARARGTRASLLGRTGLGHTGFTAGAHGLSCPTTRGTLLDQGSNPCLWQRDSLPLSHPVKPSNVPEAQKRAPEHK